MAHYTLYRLDTGDDVGCANKLLPEKVQKLLGVRMEESEQNECEELFTKTSEMQGEWDGKCSCKECYWNMYHPIKREDRNECVSESLSDTKMAPNSKECPSYWSYEEACGEPKEGR